MASLPLLSVLQPMLEYAPPKSSMSSRSFGLRADLDEMEDGSPMPVVCTSMMPGTSPNDDKVEAKSQVAVTEDVPGISQTNDEVETQTQTASTEDIPGTSQTNN